MNGEIKTAQFQLERLCPQTEGLVVPLWEGTPFPVDVWVQIPAIANQGGQCDSPTLFIVQDDRYRAYHRGRTPAVCEHMGHLIE